MKRISLYLFCLLTLVFFGCHESEKENDFITIDVTKKFPQKDLYLQDFGDIEYIPLETNCIIRSIPTQYFLLN